ncbi:MAG: hypothetical protein N2249_06770 [Melioribacter sp.]|nr:hypothetical protein [Melioribacter sp.]
MKKTIVTILTSTFLLASSIKAQTLEETLSNLSSSVGKAYVSPIISAFGSNLNSGWVSKLPPSDFLGLHFDIKVIAMGSFFSNEVKRFNASGDFYFSESQVQQILANSNITPSNVGQQNYNALKNELMKTKFSVNFSGPTIVGSKNEYVKVKFPGKTIQSGNQQYTVNPYELSLQEVKGFLDEVPALPTGAVQLTIGTVAGTYASFRYLPSVDIQDLGKFRFWGIGLIHNAGVWFKNPLPLDIAVGFFTQDLKVGDIFESSATQYGVYAGKTFGSIVSVSPYAGFTFEKSKTTVEYDYQSNETVNGVRVPPTKVKFEVEGENSSAFTLGLNIKLVAININADYKFAKTKTASVGLSLGF